MEGRQDGYKDSNTHSSATSGNLEIACKWSSECFQVQVNPVELLTVPENHAGLSLGPISEAWWSLYLKPKVDDRKVDRWFLNVFYRLVGKRNGSSH